MPKVTLKLKSNPINNIFTNFDASNFTLEDLQKERLHYFSLSKQQQETYKRANDINTKDMELYFDNLAYKAKNHPYNYNF